MIYFINFWWMFSPKLAFFSIVASILSRCLKLTSSTAFELLKSSNCLCFVGAGYRIKMVSWRVIHGLVLQSRVRKYWWALRKVLLMRVLSSFFFQNVDRFDWNKVRTVVIHALHSSLWAWFLHSAWLFTRLRIFSTMLSQGRRHSRTQVKSMGV